MLLKLGVDISRLDKSIRSKLADVDQLWQSWGEEVVVTSTYEGIHSANSLHYQHKAIDLRFPKNRTKNDVLAGLRGIFVRPDYDIVWEQTHIHVEYDPK